MAWKALRVLITLKNVQVGCSGCFAGEIKCGDAAVLTLFFLAFLMLFHQKQTMTIAFFFLNYAYKGNANN